MARTVQVVENDGAKVVITVETRDEGGAGPDVVRGPWRRAWSAVSAVVLLILTVLTTTDFVLAAIGTGPEASGAQEETRDERSWLGKFVDWAFATVGAERVDETWFVVGMTLLLLAVAVILLAGSGVISPLIRAARPSRTHAAGSGVPAETTTITATLTAPPAAGAPPAPRRRVSPSTVAVVALAVLASVRRR